jgi:hypothetical protein
MALITRDTQRQKTATATQLTALKIMMSGFLLISLGALLFATQSHAAELNLYAKNYKEQNSNNLKSLEANPDTKMYVSNHKEDDNISMLENGYDMIGSSGFDGAAVPVEGALAQGRAVKADTVLVYSKYATTKTTTSKMQLVKEAAKKGGEIDPKDLVEEPTQHQYYASYWAKLPMPLLGVHIIKLKQKSRDDDEVRVSKDEPGLKIIAVIKASPADTAHIVKGDVLLKIGDMELSKPDDLFAAVQRYAGQAVEVKVLREDASMNITVSLNSRN